MRGVAMKMSDLPPTHPKSRASVLLMTAFLPLFWIRADAQETTNEFPGIGPAIERIRFHTGQVVNNQPQISPILPAIPGSSSRWTLLQWSQPQIILPDSLKTDDPTTRDALFGVAKYAFDAPDGHSHMWIYQ